jgi:hypothetical protein
MHWAGVVANWLENIVCIGHEHPEIGILWLPFLYIIPSCFHMATLNVA